jgi:hypothetical protein
MVFYDSQQLNNFRQNYILLSIVQTMILNLPEVNGRIE